MICKIDDDANVDGDILNSVWLLTPGGKNINEEFFRSIRLEQEQEEADKANVVAKIESSLTQLKNVKLSTEEESSLEKMCLRLGRIIKDKEGNYSLSGNSINKSGSYSQKKQDTIQTVVNPRVFKQLGDKDIEKVKDYPKINGDLIKMNKRSETRDQTIKATSKHSLSDVMLWSKVSLVSSEGSKGVCYGIGLCYLKKSNRLVVCCMAMGDKKVKMFTSNGNFIKVVTCEEAEEGNISDPSAVVSLVDGGFAVSDKTRVLTFDDYGNFIDTVWSRKDYSRFRSMKCLGLGQEKQKRLVLLLDSRDQTFLCIIDSQRSEMSCFDVRDIVKTSTKSNLFNFLTVVGQSFFVTDYRNKKVYGLKFSQGGKLIKDIEISGEFLKQPAGVSVDSQGNILVADYTEDSGKISVFSEEGKLLKKFQV